MTATAYTEISCNEQDCDRAYNDRGWPREVRLRAAGEGWNVSSHDLDYCPDHADRPDGVR